MNATDISFLRITNQLITRSSVCSVAEVVAHMGALQAQDYASSLRAIASRSRSVSVSDVADAFAAGTIVRTWPMRGTLHILPAVDASWIVKLLGHRAIQTARTRRAQLGLDAKTTEKAMTLFTDLLSGRKPRTRPELYAAMDVAGLQPTGQRGIHLIGYAAQSGLICGIGQIGKQPAFALLDEWVPQPRKLEGDEALAELAWRYIQSHGPVTAKDFAWWTGSTITNARHAFAMNESNARVINVDSITYAVAESRQEAESAASGTFLLPAFDELLLGYGDRSAFLPNAHFNRVVPGSNGMFLPIVVHYGRVAGTWKRPQGKNSEPDIHLFDDVPVPDKRQLQRAIDRMAAIEGQTSR